MKKVINTICYLIDIYIYFVVICCFMTWIPNLNWDFPAIQIMFWLAGFNILPNVPVLSSFVPLILILVLISLRKFLYKIAGEQDKFFGYNTNLKEDENEQENNEDVKNDSENNNGSDTND